MKNMPTEWKKELLRAVCHRTEQWIPDKEPRGSFYYIDVSSVSNATYSLKDPVLVSADNAPGRARKILKWQDTIYATIRPSLKRVAFITKEYDGQIASTAFCVVRPDKKIAFPLYVYFFLLSDFVNRKIVELQHGASYPAVTDKDVLNQTIPLPPLPQQQKIAAILFKIQQAIEMQESIIERMQELKKTTMRHVFTYGLRGEKTKETEIGKIPESWTPKQVDSILKLSSGKTRPEKISNNRSHDSPYPVYGGNGIMGYSAEFIVSDKVLILGRVGEYCGAVHVSSEHSWISDNALYSKEWMDANVSLDYLAAYLRFFDLNRMKRKSSQPLISQSIVQELKVPIPSKTEQEEVVNIFHALDQKFLFHTAKKSALQDLFKTMLNKLMTGEIRVRDLDVDLSEVASAG